MKLYDYVFYRISRFYKRLTSMDYCWYGCLFAVNMVSIVLITVLLLFCYMLDIQYNRLMVDIPLALSVPAIFYRGNRYETREKYDQLDSHYCGEEHMKTKGWLIFVSYLLMYLLFGIMLKLLLTNR